MRIVKTIVFDKYDMERFNSLTDIAKISFLDLLSMGELKGRFIEVPEVFEDVYYGTDPVYEDESIFSALSKHGLLVHVDDEHYILTNTFDDETEDYLYMGVECSDDTGKFIAECITDKYEALRRAINKGKGLDIKY